MEASLYGKILSQGRERIVKRYPLHDLKGEVVDPRLRELIAVYNQELKSREKGAPIPPLCLDKDKKQEVRSVRCYAKTLSLDKAIPMCFDENGEPTAFVKSASNHHLALYRTPKGKLVESIVTFWDAVDRARYGIPLVITHPREVMEQVLQRGDIPESVLRSLPPSDWVFVESLQLNEMVIIGLSDEELQRALEVQDYRKLSEHLYRVQKLSAGKYFIRYHLDTDVDEDNRSGRIPKFYQLSLDAYKKNNVRKVRVDLLGRISLL